MTSLWSSLALQTFLFVFDQARRFYIYIYICLKLCFVVFSNHFNVLMLILIFYKIILIHFWIENILKNNINHTSKYTPDLCKSIPKLISCLVKLICSHTTITSQTYSYLWGFFSEMECFSYVKGCFTVPCYCIYVSVRANVCVHSLQDKIKGTMIDAAKMPPEPRESKSYAHRSYKK